MLRVAKNAEEKRPVAPVDTTRDIARHVPPHSTARMALKILGLFSTAEPVLGVTEIGRRMGLPKSNVSRLVAALRAENFLTRTENGRYRLSLNLYAMGSTVTQSHALYRVALAELCDVRMATGESTHLTALLGLNVVYLARLESVRFVKHNMSASSRSSLHATSTGRALLAYAPAETLETVIAQGLQRYTARTITDARKLRAEMAAIRARGYVIEREEFARGISSIAVPIFTKDRRTIAAISVVSPSDHLTGNRMENVARVLCQASARIIQNAS